jgi:hypothetical protein
MNCFNHRSQSAIGVCTHCGRGLCEGCCMVAPDLLSCSQGHEGRLRARELFVAKAYRHLSAAWLTELTRGIALLAIAALLVIFVDNIDGFGGLMWSLAVLVGIFGLAFIGEGIRLRRAQRVGA